MVVFIGLTEIANVAYNLSKGYRSLGHKTYSVVFRKNIYYPSSKYDLVYNEPDINSQYASGFVNKSKRWLKAQIRKNLAFLKALFLCDIYIFLSGSSFLPGYFDYLVLKLLRKKIVSIFLGSDIRYWYAYEQERCLYGEEEELRPFTEYQKTFPANYYRTKLKRVRVAERYSDLILSTPDSGQLQTRPYMRINLPLDLTLYRENIPGREVPLVLHAPSSRGVKGTEYILSAIEELKHEGVPFEFKLVEKLPNEELRELLAEADIVIDQLFSHVLGTLALESMATGNVVLARYDPVFTHIDPACPAVQVNRYTLKDRLREVIQNRDIRCHLAALGRSFVERYHCHTQIAQDILKWLQPGGIKEFDFYPFFLQNKFVMPENLLREEHRRIWDERGKSVIHLFSRNR